MYHTIIFVLLAITAPIFAELEIFDGPCPTDQVNYVKNFDQNAVRLLEIYLLICLIFDFETSSPEHGTHYWDTKKQKLMTVLIKRTNGNLKNVGLLLL